MKTQVKMSLSVLRGPDEDTEDTLDHGGTGAGLLSPEGLTVPQTETVQQDQRTPYRCVRHQVGRWDGLGLSVFKGVSGQRRHLC